MVRFGLSCPTVLWSFEEVLSRIVFVVASVFEFVDFVGPFSGDYFALSLFLGIVWLFYPVFKVLWVKVFVVGGFGMGFKCRIGVFDVGIVEWEVVREFLLLGGRVVIAFYFLAEVEFKFVMSFGVRLFWWSSNLGSGVVAARMILAARC